MAIFPIIYFNTKRARALIDDVAWICVRSKDVQNQIGANVLKWRGMPLQLRHKFHAAAVSKDAVSKDVRKQWARMLWKVVKEVRAQNFQTCYAEK